MAVIVLTRESHNLISAIRWCESAPGEIPRGLRLIGASRWVWFSLCEPEPIHSIARRFLARPEAAPRTNQRLASLLLMVQTGFDLGHYDDLRPQLEESLSIARELHNARAEGAALLVWGCSRRAR